MRFLMWEEVHVWSTLLQETAGISASECSSKSSVLLVLLLKTREKCSTLL